MARTKKTEREQALEFAVLMAFVLGVAGVGFRFGADLRLLHFPERPDVARVLWYVSPGLAFVALAFPGIWVWAYRGWMKFALALSFVMTRVILTVFFFLVMAPIGLFMRLIGKRPLALGWRDGAATYWIDKEPGEFTVERYEKQF